MIDLRLLTRAVLPVAAVALAAMFVPTLVSAFWLRTFLSVTVFTLPALGISLLFGRLGIASLSQVALVAVGGWVALRLSHATELPFLASVLLGGLVAALLGALIGLPALRVDGLFLALVTLLAAGGIEKVLITTGFPDGGPGALGRDSVGDRTPMARPQFAIGDAAYFRFLVGVAALCFVFVALARLGHYGRMWAIIGKGEDAAGASGVNVLLVRTAAFTLAGLLSGIAGGLLAGTIGYLNPASFGASESVLLFALALAAGTRSLLGPVVAALLYRAVPALFDQFGVPGDVSTVVFGGLLVHAMLSGGEGITGKLVELGHTLRDRRGRAANSAPPMDAASLPNGHES